MNCPVCEERMREVDKCGVHIDICPSCKGVWLDRGELEKLIEMAGSGSARLETGFSGSGTGRPYDGHDDHHKDRDHDHRESGERGYGERKRKGSWLGEILGGFGGGDD